jgi:hypothetical protein
MKAIHGDPESVFAALDRASPSPTHAPDGHETARLDRSRVRMGI